LAPGVAPQDPGPASLARVALAVGAPARVAQQQVLRAVRRARAARPVTLAQPAWVAERVQEAPADERAEAAGAEPVVAPEAAALVERELPAQGARAGLACAPARSSMHPSAASTARRMVTRARPAAPESRSRTKGRAPTLASMAVTHPGTASPTTTVSFALRLDVVGSVWR